MCGWKKQTKKNHPHPLKVTQFYLCVCVCVSNYTNKSQKYSFACVRKTKTKLPCLEVLKIWVGQVFKKNAKQRLILFFFFLHKLLAEWCNSSGISDNFEELAEPDLCQLLRKFYGEVRKENGEKYSKSSLCNIRAAIQRHLASPPFGRNINILKGESFVSANNVFDGSLKTQKTNGEDTTKSYPEISEEDMETLFSSDVFSLNDPVGLQRLVFFNLQYMFCRRGRKGLRSLKKDAFEVERDGANKEFLYQRYNEHSKNHPGTLNEKFHAKKKLYATDDEFCPVKTYKLYLSKLNPLCEYLFQRPKKSINTINSTTSPIWYDNMPLGHNTLGNMMKNISIDAKLSQTYTNHSIRATAIRVLSHAGVSDRMICSLSGHRNTSSLSIYCSDASDKQKHGMTSVLANGRKRRRSEAPATVSRPPTTPVSANQLLPLPTPTTTSSQPSTAMITTTVQSQPTQLCPSRLQVQPSVSAPSASANVLNLMPATHQQSFPPIFSNCNFQGATLNIYFTNSNNWTFLVEVTINDSFCLSVWTISLVFEVA